MPVPKGENQLTELFARLGACDAQGWASSQVSELITHFELDADISLLRAKLFKSGGAYGWEGPDYDSEEDHLTDHQFVYHFRYLDAIEAASGRPIYEAVRPTGAEIQELFRLLADPSGEHYYWAKWLARRLLLVPATG